MSKVNDFLKLVNETVPNTVDVFVPSCDKYITFSNITVAQQKRIIKSTLDGITGNIQLPMAFNLIIKETCREDGVGASVLISDRNAIIVQLRMAALGADVVNDADEATKLKHVQDDIESTPIETIVESNGIYVTLNVPTLAKDQLFFKILEDSSNLVTPGGIVNELYITEAAKFITTVKLGDTELSPNPKESIKLINELPLALNAKILDFVKATKKFDNDFLIAEDGSQLTLNARLFNTPD